MSLSVIHPGTLFVTCLEVYLIVEAQRRVLEDDEFFRDYIWIKTVPRRSSWNLQGYDFGFPSDEIFKSQVKILAR